MNFPSRHINHTYVAPPPWCRTNAAKSRRRKRTPSPFFPLLAGASPDRSKSTTSQTSSASVPKKSLSAKAAVDLTVVPAWRRPSKAQVCQLLWSGRENLEAPKNITLLERLVEVFGMNPSKISFQELEELQGRWLLAAYREIYDGKRMTTKFPMVNVMVNWEIMRGSAGWITPLRDEPLKSWVLKVGGDSPTSFSRPSLRAVIGEKGRRIIIDYGVDFTSEKVLRAQETCGAEVMTEQEFMRMVDAIHKSRDLLKGWDV